MVCSTLVVSGQDPVPTTNRLPLMTLKYDDVQRHAILVHNPFPVIGTNSATMTVGIKTLTQGYQVAKFLEVINSNAVNQLYS